MNHLWDREGEGRAKQKPGPMRESVLGVQGFKGGDSREVPGGDLNRMYISFLGMSFKVKGLH